MIVELLLLATALLMYKKTNLKGLLIFSASLIVVLFTRIGIAFVAFSLGFLSSEIILSSAYKPLNNKLN